MGQVKDYNYQDHPHARWSRWWSGIPPFFYLIMGAIFMSIHHYVNDQLDGKTIDSVSIASISVPHFNKIIHLSQKQQHWVLNVFALFYKSSLVRAMSYGLLQHAWRALRVADLNVRQIDCVVALQHRKAYGFFRSATVWMQCFPTVLLSFISITVPYAAAIFPGGSLIVNQVDGVAVYVYDSRLLLLPYSLGLGVTFLTILLGTRAHYKHNTSNRSFSFSHIIFATRSDIFDEALKDAKRHLVPHKILEEACKELRFGLIREGKEAFAAAGDIIQEKDAGGSDDGDNSYAA